jgi:signal transduction histidine kinase
MLRRSLTAKVLVAVGVTVAVVIAIYTYFVIRVQSAWWHERTQAQNLITATMVHEYIEGVMLSEKHDEVQQFLKKLQNTQEIGRGRIIDLNGQIIFSTETQEIHRVVLQTPPELFTEDRILHGLRTENGHETEIVMSPVLARPACLKCHDASQQFIGAIVLEKSMKPAEVNIASNRNLLIVYGVIIFVLVGVVLWLLIVRLVSQPVTALLTQMRRVERGDLGAHAEAPSPDEIGELARDFNAMVRSLDAAKRELHESHDKQMQQASKLATIGELASGIAHEIRNPLAGIGAAVEILSENGNGQNSTLRDLLEFARQREPEIAPREIRDLIKPMLALVRPDAQKQHVEIAEEYATDLPPICVDMQQIQQALLNILLNAIQAMPNGGKLTVGAASRPLPEGSTVVRITITDTGAGIASDILHKIFSPFFTTKHRGTGLGLAITRTIVEKHHGTINVETRVGRGTTFSLEFAAYVPAADESREEMVSHATN